MDVHICASRNDMEEEGLGGKPGGSECLLKHEDLSSNLSTYVKIQAWSVMALLEAEVLMWL